MLAVHVNGFGFRLLASMYSSMLCVSSSTLRKTPRRIFLSVILANQRSTWLMWGDEVKVPAGVFLQPLLNRWGFVGGVVVQHGIDLHIFWDLFFNSAQFLREQPTIAFARQQRRDLFSKNAIVDIKTRPLFIARQAVGIWSNLVHYFPMIPR